MNRERSQVLEEEYLEDHPETAGTVEPFVYDSDAEYVEGMLDVSGIPLVTDLLLSDKWEEAGESWFVDSSGFGTDGEPALTIGQFMEKLWYYIQEHPDHGFGISGVGQFQVYVSAYQRKG